MSTIKYKDVIKMPGYIMSPDALGRNIVNIKRLKCDPGAVYVHISTMGGYVATFRYAYEGKALERFTGKDRVTGFEFKLSNGDSMHVALGTRKYDAAKEKGDLDGILEDLLHVLQTASTPMTPHTEDGFMMLVRMDRYYHNSRLDPEPNQNYQADVSILCENIRECDDFIIGLIDSMVMWGNRVGVNFNRDYWYDKDIPATTARDLFTADGMTQFMTTLADMQICKDSQDFLIASMVRMLHNSKRPIWQHAAMGAQFRRANLIDNPDDYDEDYY